MMVTYLSATLRRQSQKVHFSTSFCPWPRSLSSQSLVQSWLGSCVACLSSNTVINNHVPLHYITSTQRSTCTYAVVCWPSQSSSQYHISPVGNGAQTSSTPHVNRRRARILCSSHHRIVSGSRSRRLDLYSLCKVPRVFGGVRPWTRWHDLDGEHRFRGRVCQLRVAEE